MSYLGQEIKKVYPTSVAMGGANMGQVPLFSVQWWANRTAIPAGYVAADGQELPKFLYPDADAGIQANNVPLTTEANWQSDATQRGKFVATSSAGKFRVPDYNGKSAGSLGAVFLRGDGSLSAAVAGVIQRDAFQGHKHRFNYRIYGGQSGSAAMGNDIQSNPGSGDGFVDNPISDGVNGSPRTASETRPLNVTGCFIIKLFGVVTNAGAADAAQLATEYASLVGALQSFESRYDDEVDFTVIYPNGGSAENAASIALNTRLVEPNPFPGHHVVVEAQVLFDGKWGATGWADNYSGNGAGTVAHQLGDDIIIQTGQSGTAFRNVIAGGSINLPSGTVYTSPVPVRVRVWKVKGAIA